MKLEQLIENRAIPDVLTGKDGSPIRTAKEFEKMRPQILKLLAEEEYGAVPEAPDHLDVTEIEGGVPHFAAGKAPLRRLRLHVTKGEKEFSFPITEVIPKNPSGKVPAFILINFRPDVPDKYLPSEEIVDRGYAVFSFYYNDISPDRDVFRDAGSKFFGKGRRALNAPGKIAMWAWAAMRVMDYVQTIPKIDKDHIAVIGHSRLGKTALYAGANDERFRYVISNDSGCSGAAITRNKIGEKKEDITRVFPYWFCPRYNKPTKIESLRFDQNFLLAMIPPRNLIVGSAENDSWADPESEFLATYMTNRVYALYGMRGLVTPDEVPGATAYLGEGDSCYELRRGDHYLSREDWNRYMDFIDSKRK